MQDLDVVREFLIESHENLSRLDQDLVALEKNPQDAVLLGSIFRCVHTVKGTCGFLAFSTLEKITHQAENLLSQLRSGELRLSPRLVSLILETIDAMRRVLASIEANGAEGAESFEELTDRLRMAAHPDAKEDAEPPATPIRAEHPEEEASAGTTAAVKAGGDTTRSSAVADANIRVGVGLLDKLMDLVGELVLTRNQILQFNTEREDAALNATSQRLNLITTELQEGVMKTRMQPIGRCGTSCPAWCATWPLPWENRSGWRWKAQTQSSTGRSSKPSKIHWCTWSATRATTASSRPEVRVRSGKPAQGRLSLARISRRRPGKHRNRR